MLLERVQVPGALVPLIILRMFSSSAATGLCLDIFQQYGPDSRIGHDHLDHDGVHRDESSIR